jgi:ABC-type multidrug transport system ATPase subunit
MSEQILKALMQLFAIIARPESNAEDRRTVVESFLKRQLNQELVNEYLKVFDEFYSLYQEKQKEGDQRRRRISASSVKVLKICSEINEELAQPQKIIVLIQLLEFVKSDNSVITDQEMDFLNTVAESFFIPEDEYKRMKEFTHFTFEQLPDDEEIMIIDGKEDSAYENLKTKHVKNEALLGQIRVLNIQLANLYFIRYIGHNEIYMNGQMLERERVYPFNYGASLRNQQIKPIYYSDIVSRYAEDKIKSKIVFAVRDLEYRFKNGKLGLHYINFTEYSGSLVGIMGASGAGKSTLLNVLNGSTPPTGGSVKINDVSIHTEKDQIEGIIGHVSQDDLLIEELSVFQNLYYNAKLCFDDYSEEQLETTVDKVLKNLGLYEIKDIQVGSPLNKKISGGQRKRLNIALELIREPAVLFLDEPTSGLSSRDSENILDLLKELSLKGKLVFVVIHQPSSDIFKMFDKLLILDTGGYLIYNGNPVDSIVYFKSKVHHANWNESECHTCGNVNPEQVFNIVEASVLDEYGKLTDHRKISPTEWSEFYGLQKSQEQEVQIHAGKEDLPEISFKVPGRFKQFRVFVARDVLKKLSDTQYLAINFLEAPILSFFLAYIIKYFSVDVANEYGYTLFGNSNLPIYIFMSVIVAIFMGLTVSAEEIIKDRKILKREAFLNLSWSGYLMSKVFVQFALSAIQAATWVIIGNSIMEIRGMYFEYWLVLFSTWAFSNILGLLISDSFKTVVTIYILIPFLVIPQIILSGIMVKFEKLNPKISSPEYIPIYGEIWTARWAYEALATYQFIENDYQKKYYEIDKLSSNASFKDGFLINELNNKLAFVENNLGDPTKKEKINYNLNLIRNEIIKEMTYRKILKKEFKSTIDISFPKPERICLAKADKALLKETGEYLATVRDFYAKLFKHLYNKKNDMKMKEDQAVMGELKRRYSNESLEEFVTNKNEYERIVEYKGKLIQKTDPIYLDPLSPFIKAHFYAPRKMIFGEYYKTYWVNVIVIWLTIMALYAALYYRLLKKFLDFFENLEFGKKSK